MINIKPIIKKALDVVCNNVVDGYPSTWESFPIIAVEEENNVSHTITDDAEQIATIRYRIDIWTENESASKLAIKAEEALFNLGLVRIGAQDAPELRQGMKHKILRFEGDVDVHTMHVYHN
ncbi:MAG: hypothetical protein RR791_05185 [Lachnospiraceae bacterium]